MEVQIRMAAIMPSGRAMISTGIGSADPVAPRVVWAGLLKDLPGVPNGCTLWVSPFDFAQLKKEDPAAPAQREEAPEG